MFHKIFLPFCFILGLSYGCSEKAPTNVQQGNADQVLYVANADEPEGIDPHVVTGSPDANVINSIFEGLTTLHPKTLAVQPGVAERWDISEDRTIYTFYIRENAKWSNGDPLTAEDFVYSWKRALEPATGNLYSYMMYMIKNAEAFNTGKIKDFSEVGIKALEPYKLQVTLNSPTLYFLQVLDHYSFFPVPQKVIEKLGDTNARASKWTRPENIVTNGAFMLENWEINKQIRVKKNPHYWDADYVRLNAIVFYPISDQQAEERAFRSEQVHLTYTPQMAIEKIATYQEKSPEVFKSVPVYSSYYYFINNTRKPFDDVRVRKALAYAIDRDAIVKRITKGGEIPAYSFVAPDPEGYQPQVHFKYDVEKARELLAEAGYPNGEGFPTFEILYNTHDNHRKVALAIQQMLKTNLNIDVGLLNQEWKVYITSQNNKQYEVSRAAWIADYVEPSSFFEILLSDGGNNDTGWKNEEYDSLVEQAKVSLDEKTRFELYERANKILAEEMPLIPIYYPSDINLVRTNVKNWFGNALHRHPYKHVYLEQ